MKKLLYLVAMLPLLFACSQEDGLENSLSALDQDVINKVSVTVLPLNERAETRTTLKYVNNIPVFVWGANDNIGIFPDQGYQVGFSMSSAAGSTTAEFNGGGWGLKASSTYAAYYPAQPDLYLNKKAIPLRYTGQTQVGNSKNTYLGAYDYLSAPASNPVNGSVNFTFGHLGTLLHFRFTPPTGVYDFTSIVLKTDGRFTEEATFDLTTNQMKATATSATQTLLLEDVSVPKTGGILNAYMMIAPVNLSGNSLVAYITSAAGDVYMAELTGRNFVGGEYVNFEPKNFQKVAAHLGHDYVDLGITDSNGNTVLWATTNVGADNPWEYGGYYAWGETKAYGEEDTSNKHNYTYSNTYKKSYYGWSTYKWATGSDWTSISKYSFADNDTSAPWYQMGGTYIGLNGVENQKKLELADDAAHMNWGNGWRMPTSSELESLINNCYWKWVTAYKGHAVNGYVVYKAKNAADKGKVNESSNASYSESTDAHIFLPAAGCRYSSNLSSAGGNGYYWSSELYSNSYYARSLNFGSGNVSTNGGSYRYVGRSVRPVRLVQN